jgi:ankyrin repeat protein
MGKGKKSNGAEDLPYVDGTDPLYRAANNGDMMGVKRVLAGLKGKKERWTAANCRNEDAGDNSPLHVAASRGYLLMATHLLDVGAELLPDEKGRTPLHLAAANDDTDMVKLLLKRCKDPWRAKMAFTTSGGAVQVEFS